MLAAEPGSGPLRLLHLMPDDSQWDRTMLAGFLPGSRFACRPS